MSIRHRASSLFRRPRLFEPSFTGSESHLGDITEEKDGNENEGAEDGEPLSSRLPEPSLKVKRLDYYWNWFVVARE